MQDPTKLYDRPDLQSEFQIEAIEAVMNMLVENVRALANDKERPNNEFDIMVMIESIYESKVLKATNRPLN